MEENSFTVHLLLLKDLLKSFKNGVKDVKANYFSRSRGNPKVLFDAITDIVTFALPAVPIFSK